jgi:DNA-directed RNA polymerase specialized sigma24 family protein
MPHYPQDELALEHRAAAVTILKALTRSQREAVLLAALGLTHDEIGEVLNVCTSAVTQRMGRARERLSA